MGLIRWNGEMFSYRYCGCTIERKDNTLQASSTTGQKSNNAPTGAMVESTHVYLGLDLYDRPVIIRKVYQAKRAYMGTEEGGYPRTHTVNAGDFAQLPPRFEISCSLRQ